MTIRRSLGSLGLTLALGAVMTVGIGGSASASDSNAEISPEPASEPAGAKVDRAHCSFKGVPLRGKVKVVDSFPDLKVKVVRSFSDLKVKKVDAFAEDCGEWQFVDSFPDFTIQYVASFADIDIEIVDRYPGIP